jgi:pimeloyl-ACP methyl ester carboxylesterase/DNA-binding CsgD family transcriptional regulator
VSRIAFCTAPDGVSLAYGLHGNGPPLVKAANWLTHIEFDWESPVWRHWLRALGERNTFVRYDERGCGLSDRDIDEESFSHETWLSDLETVVDAADLDRFALLGVSQGASLAITYAVHHPDRVTHLVLYGGYVRGRLYRGEKAAEQAQMFHSVIRTGWGQENSAFRRLFTSLFLPEGTPEQMVWFDELQRTSASPETAARIYWAQADTDVIDLAKRVRTPTLVLHATDDALVPFEEGRQMASLILGARFVPLEGRNHILLEDEPAWPAFLDAVHEFLDIPAPAAIPLPPTEELSVREREVLALVADGLTNEEIAERLFLSPRTVERHLSNVYVKLRVSGKAARAAAAARYVQDATGASRQA